MVEGRLQGVGMPEVARDLSTSSRKRASIFLLVFWWEEEGGRVWPRKNGGLKGGGEGRTRLAAAVWWCCKLVLDGAREQDEWCGDSPLKLKLETGSFLPYQHPPKARQRRVVCNSPCRFISFCVCFLLIALARHHAASTYAHHIHE